MSSRFLERFLVTCVLAILACSSRAESRDLVVCADPDNLPFSDQNEAGFENRLAELVARDLGAQLIYHWLPLRRGAVRKTLEARLCDVLMGVPVDPHGVATTNAYYRSSYVLVTRSNWGTPISSFDDTRLRTSRIGVPLIGGDGATIPPASALARRGNLYNIQGFPVYGALPAARRMVDALTAGELDVAVGWGPSIGYFARHAKIPLVVAPAPDDILAPGSFSIAIAVGEDERELRDDLNALLDRQRATIDAVLTVYGVPMLPLHDAREQ